MYNKYLKYKKKYLDLIGGLNLNPDYEGDPLIIPNFFDIKIFGLSGLICEITIGLDHINVPLNNDLLYDNRFINDDTIVFLKYLLDTPYFNELRDTNQYFSLSQNTEILLDARYPEIEIINNIELNYDEPINLNIILKPLPEILVICTNSNIPGFTGEEINVNDLTFLEGLAKDYNGLDIELRWPSPPIYDIIYRLCISKIVFDDSLFFDIKIYRDNMLTLDDLIFYEISISNINVFKNFIHRFLRDANYDIYLDLFENLVHTPNILELNIIQSETITEW
jgi:hypothetical protein